MGAMRAVFVPAPSPRFAALLLLLVASHARTPSPAERQELARALLRVWEVEDRTGAPVLATRNARSGQPSLHRLFLNRYIQETAASGIGQNKTCLEWGPPRYAFEFGCSVVYDFRHATKPVFNALSPRRGGGPVVGRVHGDLQDGLAHVPSNLVDVMFSTMVFEHVPQFWRAMRVLHRLTRPGGWLVWATPFYYRYHPIPGDFWRMTYQGCVYLLESNDFEVCNMAADGARSAQLHTLGLDGREEPGMAERAMSGQQQKAQLLQHSTQFMMLARKRGANGSAVCREVRGINVSNAFTHADIRRHGWKTGYWPVHRKSFEGLDAVPWERGEVAADKGIPPL